MADVSDAEDYGGYLIEMTPVGSSVKVCAVDPLTGLEAVVVGSSQTPSHMLANMAVRKLKALLGHEDEARQQGQGDVPRTPPRRGLMV